MRKERTTWCFLTLVLLTSVACSSGGGDGVVGPPAVFTPSGTAPASDEVRLTGVAVDNDTVQLDVTINGETDSQDLYAFAFDLLLSDPTFVQLVPGSAAAGDALVPGSGQGMSVIVTQQVNRVVVGVSIAGGGEGNQIPGGDHVVVRMELQVTGTGISTIDFAGSPSNPQNPTTIAAALDSAGAVIPDVIFDSAAAMISR